MLDDQAPPTEDDNIQPPDNNINLPPQDAGTNNITLPPQVGTAPPPVDMVSGGGAPAGNYMPTAPSTPPTPYPIDKSPLSPLGLADANIGSDQNKQTITTEAGKIKSGLHNDNSDILDKESKEEAKQLQDLQKVADTYKNQEADNAKADEKAAIALGNQKTDPEHWWNSKTTGGKVQAAIGMMLGGLGQGLMVYGGNKDAHNYAIDAMNDAIKSDIESQDGQRKDRVESVTKRMGIHNNSVTSHHIDMNDRQHQFILGQEVFKTQLMKAAEESGSQEAINNAKAQVALIDDEIAKERENKWNYNANLAAQVQAGIKERENKADKYASELRTNNKELGEGQVLDMVHQRFPEVARYAINTSNFPVTKPIDPAHAHDSFDKQEAALDDRSAMIDQLSADPNQELTKEQEKLLGPVGEKAGLIKNWWNGGPEERIKGIAAARASIAEERAQNRARFKEALGSANPDNNPTPGKEKPALNAEPEGSITMFKGGKKFQIPNSKVDAAMKNGYEKSDTSIKDAGAD